MSDRMKTVLAWITAVVVLSICVIGVLRLRANCQAKGGEWLRGAFSMYQCYEVKGVLK